MVLITEFTDYRDFLKETFREKSARNRTFSLRAFARMVGVSSSHLSRTLNGKKRLSLTSAHKISTALNHNQEELNHFLNLVELDYAETNEAKTKILRKILNNSESKSQLVSIETMRAISDWYHFAILSLMNTRGFDPNPNWIAQRLGIKPFEAKLGLERLLAAGLIEKAGKTYRAVNDAEVTTTNDIASVAIQENHRQHLAKAADALTELSVELRQFSNTTLAVDPANITKARKLIRSFIDQFSNSIETKPGSELFQLNVQFYQLTKNERLH